MVWGFQTCGPNEALVVSGRYRIDENPAPFSRHKKSIFLLDAWMSYNVINLQEFCGNE